MCALARKLQAQGYRPARSGQWRFEKNGGTLWPCRWSYQPSSPSPDGNWL